MKWRIRFPNDSEVYYAVRFIIGSQDSIDGIEYISEDQLTHGQCMNDNLYTLEACTGRFDKNRKLIYENDVLMISTPSGYQTLKVIRIGAEFFVKTKTGSTYYLNEFNTETFEIQSDLVMDFIMS